MTRLYPLRFHPIYRRYIWGGRRLETLLGKSLGPGNDYAESWELVDRPDAQSVVAAGPLAGQTLGALVAKHGEFVFGRHPVPDRFPLLLKFLDAHDRLSVQVHPTDEQARRLDPPDLGKTEAWVILAAEPQSKIWAGLKPGVDRQVLQRAVDLGRTAECLEVIEPHVGDCIFIPAGTVHALGEGLVVYEIQQASDTTFRLFDWNRVGADGKPRPLHIEQAMETIRFDAIPVAGQTPQMLDERGAERLVACDKFILDRHHVQGAGRLGGDGRFHLVSVIDGRLDVEGDSAEQPLRTGQTILLPASLGQVTITAREPATVLDAYLP